MADILNRCFKDLAEYMEDLQKLRNQGDASANEFAAKRKDAMMYFVLIKKISRNEKYKIRSKRDELQLEKVRIDSNRLQLQNLLYEINHLKREIRRCYNFKSGDEDLNILSQENYMQLLGLDKSPSSTPIKRQMLLECELRLRKQLSTEYKELLSSKKQINKDIISKVELLASFAPSLQNLIKAIRPLQESLQLPLDEDWKIQKLVQLLPEPLYIVYMNTYALVELYNSEISISVVGCENLVNEMDHLRHITQLKEAIQMVAEETATLNDKEKLFQPHPLSLQLLIGDLKSNDGFMAVKIFYFPKLHILTANSKLQISEADTDLLPSPDILKHLYADDLGEIDSTDIEIKLSKNGSKSDELENYLIKNNLGKPYQWLQEMSGIKIHSNNPDRTSIKIRQRIDETLSLLREIWFSRLNLYKQIKLLMLKNIDSIQIENIPTTPPSCSLVQWSSISMEEYSANVATEPYINLNILNDSNVFYRSVIVRGAAKMECFISISNKFPYESPFWSMCVHWNKQFNSTNCVVIKIMENWTNSLEVQNFKNSMSLLPAQLMRTMHSFDIFLETESLYSGPSEFLKEKHFIKPFSKRIRLRPFRCLDETNVNLFKQ